jgi:hypothetical protein
MRSVVCAVCSFYNFVIVIAVVVGLPLYLFEGRFLYFLPSLQTQRVILRQHLQRMTAKKC